MFRFLGGRLRWFVVPSLLLAGLATGGADGIVGWFMLGWMLWRGGPGMWADIRRVFAFLGSGKFRFRRGRRVSLGDGLNS